MKSVATIGYEGATVPAVLEALRGASVELVIDIRAIASSRRPGFAKTALAANLATIGVEYLHLRGLGTPADGRAAARSGRQDELERIFREHLETEKAQVELRRLVEIVRSGRRVALLCFEADAGKCHRRFVAEEVRRELGVEIVNLAPQVEE